MSRLDCRSESELDAVFMHALAKWGCAGPNVLINELVDVE
jgi:hypothetical protein